MYFPVIVKKFSQVPTVITPSVKKIKPIPKSNFRADLRKKIRKGNLRIISEMKDRGSLDKLKGHKDITKGLRWNKAKKIGIGVGAVATGTTALAVGTVGSALGAAELEARSAGNKIRKAIPNPPKPVGLAQQANPAAQPQQVTHV